ncbi:reverse transcriptase-like protein [Cutibacterium acnes]
MNGAETRYPAMEKLAFAVVISTRKLRPYFQSHPIAVLSSQPLRTILHSPGQSGRLAKWAIELSEYDIEYRNRTTAKSQVIADFLVELSPELDVGTETEDKNWKLFVDGASSKKGAGIGIRLISPTGEILEQSFKLGFTASNNTAEYEALLAGLRLAREIGVRHLLAHCDSMLVANQIDPYRSARKGPIGRNGKKP